MGGVLYMYQTIELTIEGRLAQLKLNRPESMNAMDDRMMKEIADALESLKANATIQVVLIIGEGRVFSAGGDVKLMASEANHIDMNEVMADLARLATELYTLPQITIAAIHGAAAGLGLSLALGCDYVLAEEDSKLAMNFIGIGLVPDGGGHFFLKERVGIPEAKKLMWTGATMNANEAVAKRLIDKAIPAGQANVASFALANQLLASPIVAMIASKKILQEQKIAELELVLKMEKEAQIAMRQTADHLEGIQAFIGKRKPKFKGN